MDWTLDTSGQRRDHPARDKHDWGFGQTGAICKESARVGIDMYTVGRSFDKLRAIRRTAGGHEQAEGASNGSSGRIRTVARDLFHDNRVAKTGIGESP